MDNKDCIVGTRVRVNNQYPVLPTDTDIRGKTGIITNNAGIFIGVEMEDGTVSAVNEDGTQRSEFLLNPHELDFLSSPASTPVNHVPSNEAAHAMSDALGKFLGRSAEGNFISDRDYLLRELYQIVVNDWVNHNTTRYCE